MRAHHVGNLKIHSWFALDMGVVYSANGYMLVSMNVDAVETYYVADDHPYDELWSKDEVWITARIFSDGRMVIRDGESHLITVVLCGSDCCGTTSERFPFDMHFKAYLCNGMWCSQKIGGFVVVWG